MTDECWDSIYLFIDHILVGVHTDYLSYNFYLLSGLEGEVEKYLSAQNILYKFALHSQDPYKILEIIRKYYFLKI